MHNIPHYNEYFVLSLAVSKNDMMIQMVDKQNTTQGSNLTFEVNSQMASTWSGFTSQ